MAYLSFDLLFASKQILSQLCFQLYSIFRILPGPKAARALLIQFCSWSHAIKSDVKQFTQFDGVYHAIDVMENNFKHSFLCCRLDVAKIIAMGTIMYNTVDIKVKVIKNFVFAALTIYHSFLVFVSQPSAKLDIVLDRVASVEQCMAAKLA